MTVGFKPNNTAICLNTIKVTLALIMEEKRRPKQPVYRYVAAVVSGFIIVFLPDIEPIPIPLALITFAFGLLFGFIWSTESWRWGLWIAGPAVILILLSVVFSGYSEIFLRKDLPIMISITIAACSGSFAGAWVKRRRAMSS